MNNKLASGMIALSLAASGSVIADDVGLLDLDNLEISSIGEIGLSGAPVDPVSNIEVLDVIELAGNGYCVNTGACESAMS